MREMCASVYKLYAVKMTFIKNVYSTMFSEEASYNNPGTLWQNTEPQL